MKTVFGVGVTLIKNKKVLLGYHTARKYEQPSWAMPGGHVDSDENIYKAAIREVFEETGIKLSEVIPIGFFDDYFEDYRVLSFQVFAEIKEQEPKILEPNKIEKWEWFELDNIPENLSPITARTLEVFKKTEYSKL